MPRPVCSVCCDTHFVSISFFGKRAAVCTCLADPDGKFGEMVMHSAWCDSVPCPFDTLMETFLPLKETT